MNLWLKIKQKYLVVRTLGTTKIVLMPFAMAFVGLLLIVSKFVRVRIHPVINSRIGHFAPNTEISVLTIKERQIHTDKREINIFCATSETSCNESLEKMWKRKLSLKTGNWGWLLNDISKRIKGANFYQASTANDKEGLLISFPPSLTFSEAEKTFGEDFLAENGISDPNKIVCLNVRDSSFLAISEPLGWSKSRDWSYHDYRDSKISTYVTAAETLADMGYTVFRMGAIVKEPLISKHPRVIDYATNGMRTEFLDIFLGAYCTFCVSTGSGWDSIPQIFRRPSLYVNFIPLFAPECVVRDLLIYPKILQDDSTKNNLVLDEIIERNVIGSLFSAEYSDAGVTIRDMSSDELVVAVAEMAARVEGTFMEKPEQKQMQEKIRHIFSTHPKLQPTPNCFPVRAKFASCFYSHYPNFLD
ncbi:unannotated protein [freshwater metagenome]|uniref:Unannotated protein n=1 Tax=freshwater metagenome TaxID=449393 RepID=A0A6J6U9D5_9ZZZZ